jgi:type VII secretion-associated serine protease mycosin
LAAVLAASFAIIPALPASADPIRDGEYWLTEYGITTAWTVTQGAGVTIAIIDTGIDSSVPELRGAVIGGADFSGLGSSNGQTPVGSTGSEHGTLVASLAAGRGRGPDTGVIGAAPAANLLSISIGFGEGEVDSDTQIADAVRWAVDHGADVINMSLTRNTLEWPESWDDAFLYAAENDVVIVAAAGNRGSGTTVVGAPATMPGVLTVAGVDRLGEASFDASSQGITIGIAAPSEELIGVAPGGTIVRWGGTSGATPIVAGIVALVRSAHPELDAANVINRITATARPAGESGPDPIYGFGIVDAAAAVTADVPLVDANPMGDLAEWVRLYRRADVVPSAPPVPWVPPAVEPDAPVAAPVGPSGVLIPTLPMLREVGIPLLAIGLLAGSIVGIASWALRRVDGLPRSR